MATNVLQGKFDFPRKLRSRRSSSQPVRNRQPLTANPQASTDINAQNSCNQVKPRLSNKNAGMDLISSQKRPISNSKPAPNVDDAAVQQLRKLIRLRETIEKFQRKKLDNLNADIAFYDKSIKSTKSIVIDSNQQKNALLLTEYYEKIIQLQKQIRDLYERLEILEMTAVEEVNLQTIYTWNDLAVYQFDPISFVSSTETRV